MAKTSRRRLIEAEDLLRIIRLGSPVMSPDGKHILFTTRTFGEQNDQPSQLWLAATDGSNPRRLTAGPRDRAGQFAPDGKRVFFVREIDKGAPQLAVIPIDGGEAEVLSSMPPGAIGAMQVSASGLDLVFTYRATESDRTSAAADARGESGESEPPIITESTWYRHDGEGYFGSARWVLRTLDLRTGTLRTIDARDNCYGYDFDLSPEGNSVAFISNRAKRASLEPWKQEVRIAKLRSGSSRKLDWMPRGPKGSIAYSPDGKHLAFAGRMSSDDAYSTENLELLVADLKKKTVRSLSSKTDWCLMAATLSDCAEAAFDAQLLWTNDGKNLITRIGWHGEGRIVCFPVSRSRPKVLLEGPADVSLGTLDQRGEQLALLRAGATELPEVFVARLSKSKPIALRRLTHFNDQLLSELKLARPKSKWIKAEDGTRVQTWIMRPPNASTTKKTPGILEVHGGPHAQYGWSFFHEFQLLAAKGWTVFYSNPRGSKGYGQAHCEAIRGSWGIKDWQDVQAVTAFMQSSANIDSKRIGIMGGSYGGYITNWAIGHSKAYRAAITDRCVSNLLSMVGSSDFIWTPDTYWPGAPWDRAQDLWEASPIKHMKGAKTPTLIIHSEGDLRCNIEQAEQVHAALAVQKVPCRFVRYPRSTSHGMSRGGAPDMRLHRLGEIVAWWKRYF